MQSVSQPAIDQVLRAERRGGSHAHVQRAVVQGLTLACVIAELEDLRDTSLTLELNLSTFGTHRQAILGHVGVKVSFC